MQEEKNKTCKNCRFYYQHYVKSTQRYTKTFCGHCAHTYGKKVFDKNLLKVCKYWEEQVPKGKQRRESIKDTIYFMSDCLKSMCSILEDDDET